MPAAARLPLKTALLRPSLLSTRQVDIGALVKEGLRVLKRNYTIAIPTVIGIFAVNFISLLVVHSPEQTVRVIIMALVMLVLSSFSHGVTLAMAREALERGSTTLSTAWLVATRLLIVFFSLSVIISLLIIAGSMLFLFPGIAAAFYLMFAFPAVVVEGAGTMAALSRSVRVVRANTKESFIVFVFTLVATLVIALINIILSTVPVLGQLAGVVLSAAFSAVVAVVIMRVYKDLTRQEPA